MTRPVIRLLGPLEIVADDGELIVVGALKRRAVCAVLAANLNQVVPVGQMLDLVWDGDPPPQARTALQGHISALRKLLHDRTPLRVVTRPPGYAMVGDRHSVDSVWFATLMKQATDADTDTAIELLTQAVALWRGRPLADLSDGSLDAVATALHDDYVTALGWLGERQIRVGRADLLPAVQDALREDPLREDLVQVGMRMLYQQHRQADSLSLYDRTRRALATELGVEPSPALQAAYQDILAARPVASAVQGADRSREVPDEDEDVSPPLPVPAQLPRRPAVFAGRAAELARLAEYGRVGAVVVLTGGAGSGKTALALEWAHRLAAEHTDGQLFVDLRGYDESGGASPHSSLASLLRSLGVASAAIPESLADRSGLLRSLLAHRQVLLVIDSARTAEQVEPLLPASSRCTVLVTSRHRLDSLLVSTQAQLLEVPRLPESDAIELLERLLGRDRTAVEPTAVRELVRLCDGLPLALRISMARLATRPNWPIQVVVDELAGEQRRLAGLATSDNTMSVTAALNTTRRTLDADTAHLCTLLGLFAPVVIDSYAIAALADWPQRQTRQCLAKLADAHLVEEVGPEQYTRHDLVRLYFRELADELPETVRRPAQERLVRHYGDTSVIAHDSVTNICYADAWRGVVPTAPTRFETAHQAVDWFKDTEPALREMVLLACDLGMVDVAWRIVDQNAVLFFRAGNAQTWLDVAERAWRAAVAAGDVEGGIICQYRYATALSAVGRPADAAEHLVDALSRTGPDTPDLRRYDMNYHLGWAEYERGRYAEALAWYERAMALSHGLGKDTVVYVHNQMALVAIKLGDLSRAEEYIGRALTGCVELELVELHKAVLCTQGTVQEQRDDLDGAWQSYQDALAMALDQADDRCRAKALRGMGNIQRARGNLSEARLIWQAEHRLLRHLASPEADDAAARLSLLDQDVELVESATGRPVG